MNSKMVLFVPHYAEFVINFHDLNSKDENNSYSYLTKDRKMLPVGKY